MNFANRLAIAGLLLIALAVIIVEVESRSANNGLKQHVEQEADKIISKRQAQDEDDDESGSRADSKAVKKAKKAAEEAAPAAPKKKSHSKKPAVDGDKPGHKTTSTTKKPSKGAITTKKAGKAHGSTSTTTKMPSKKDVSTTTKKGKKKGGDDDDEAADDEAKPKKDEAEPESADRLLLTIRKKDKAIQARARQTNEKWLLNQETVAIEHMLAGVYDWAKVLKQTNGKTYNKLAAGELFEMVNNHIAKLLSAKSKPDDLIKYYETHK